MPERPSYFWSYAFSWGLTASGGALAVVGVLAYFLPESIIAPDVARLVCVLAFAGVVGFSVACANCTAAAAQHAISRTRFYPWTFWPALICTLGFCFATGIGMHLGWALLTQGSEPHALPDARLVNTVAVFMALAKPAMNWIIEGRRAIDRDDADAAEAADNARRDALRQADIAARSATVTQLRPRTGRTATAAAGAAALASMAVLGAPQTQAEAAPLVQQDAPTQAQPDASGAAMETQPDAPKRAAKARVKGTAAIADADYEARVADALRLLLEAPHVSNRQVARQSGLSPSSVDRLARTVTPLGSSETTSGG